MIKIGRSNRKEIRRLNREYDFVIEQIPLLKPKDMYKRRCRNRGVKFIDPSEWVPECENELMDAVKFIENDKK